MEAVIIVLYIATGLVMLVAWWRIYDRAGLGGAYSLLLLVPVVNIFVLLYLAYGDWPALRKPPTPKLEESTTGTDHTGVRSPCPKCGENIMNEAKFCRFCRSELSSSRAGVKTSACPYCTHLILENAAQCESCRREKKGTDD